MFHRESGVFKTTYTADMALYPLPIAKWTVAALALIFIVILPLSVHEYYLSILNLIFIAIVGALGLCGFGLVGFGAGAGLAGVFGLTAGGQDSKVALSTPWQLLVISFFVVIAICLLSALISIRKVVKLEPAVVFRG